MSVTAIRNGRSNVSSTLSSEDSAGTGSAPASALMPLSVTVRLATEKMSLSGVGSTRSELSIPLRSTLCARRVVFRPMEVRISR